MLLIIWLVLSLVVVSVILLLPALLWRREIRERYSGSRLVACPENQQSAAVNFDTHHAAETGVDGCPELRLCDCTRWPERSNCDQGCLSQAVQAEPYSPAPVKARAKQIYHLPIVLAAFAAWCLGAIWHSKFLFRAQWMNAIGLTHAQFEQIVWWLSPHLLSAAGCLLFAYGVAWLLAVSHRKGVLKGMLMSVLLAAAVIAASSFDIAKLPYGLLLIEAGYIALASLMVGAIVGGLYGELVTPSQRL